MDHYSAKIYSFSNKYQKYILYLITVAVLSGCNNKNNKEDEYPKLISEKDNVSEKPTTVEVNRIGYGFFKTELISNGKVEAKKKSNIQFLIAGVVQSIYVNEGDNVVMGQVLACIDADQQKRSFKQMTLRYDQSKLDYEDQLLRLGIQLRDTAESSSQLRHIAKIRSGYSNALIELDRSSKELKNTKLTAPFSGQIANLKSRIYNNTLSTDYFCTLIDDSEIIINFSILEQELSLVRLGMNIRVCLFQDERNFRPGIVASINPIVDKSGMLTVRAIVKNQQRFFRDGMNVKVVLENQIANQLVVPKSAVLEREGRKVVFTAKNNLAYWNYVEVSHENSTSVSISKGLKDGDTVIFRGNFNLAHEKTIRIGNTF